MAAWEPTEEQMVIVREVTQKNFEHFEANVTPEERAAA